MRVCLSKTKDLLHFGDVGEGKQIAWLRMNTRTDSKGRNVLFLEEMQSQRGADGREYGFSTDDNLRDKEFFVPPAPFVTDANNKATNAYISLLLKKAISEAVDNGQTVVAWTTSAQQSDRYDLSKKVDRIEYHSDKRLKVYDNRGLLVVNEQLNNDAELENYIGKDLTEKLLSQPEERIRNRLNAIDYYQARTLHRVDMKTYPNWTKVMYGDEQGLNGQGKPSLVLQAASAIAKKMGGEIASVAIEGIGQQPALIVTPKMLQKVLDEGLPLFSRVDQPRLAPNGKPSNLNAMQYAQVRTPEFKAWFGDWEQSMQKPVPITELNGNEIEGITPAEARKNAKIYIEQLINALINETGKDAIKNTRTGIDIRLTAKGVVHGFQHHGWQHVKSVAAIKKLIENAAKIAVNFHQPYNENFNKVITFVAPLKLGDQFFAVKLTVKESWDGKAKLYDHQALEMKKPDGIYESTSDETDSIRRPASSSFISLDEMLKAFKGKDKKYLASKVVDENGEPLVVYHGTASSFNKFNESKIGKTYGVDDRGFFFTTDADEASDIASFDAKGRSPNLMPVFLAVKNPLLVNYADFYWRSYEKKTATNTLDRKKDFIFDRFDEGDESGLAYDGVMVLGEDGNKTIVVFHPNQIKSATGNTGAFSSDNNNIRFSKLSDMADSATAFINQQLDHASTFNGWHKTVGTHQGYSPAQRTMYHEFFAAVNKSLDELARSEMLREAKALKLLIAAPDLNLMDTAHHYASQLSDQDQMPGLSANPKRVLAKFNTSNAKMTAKNSH